MIGLRGWIVKYVLIFDKFGNICIFGYEIRESSDSLERHAL